MPLYNVKAPDGSIIPVNAPEGATEQQAIEFAAATWKPSAAQPQAEQNQDTQAALKETLGETSWAGRNLAGAGSAAAKTYYGAKQLLKGGTLSPEDQQAVKDWSTIEQEAPVGAVAGNIGMMVAPGMGLSKVPLIAGTGRAILNPATVAKSAAVGAGYTGIQPTSEQGAEGLQQRGIETAKGAAFGAAGYGAAKGLGRVLSPALANPNVSDDYIRQVQLLQNEGIPTTVGQKMGGASRVTESKLTSTPAVGDLIGWRQSQGIDKLNIAAYNRALSPIGEKSSGKIGFDGVEEVHTKLSNAYQKLAGEMNFKPDQTFGSDLKTIRTMVDELPDQYAGLYDKLVNRIVTSRATPQGNMSGETLKNVESSLGKEISLLRSKGGYEHQKIADALEATQQSIRENLARQNPVWANKLQKVNEGWSNYAIIRDAASTATGRKGGAFTPANLASAVSANAKRQAGQTVGKARISEGRANMQDLSSAAENVLAPAYPDSGTAGRTLPWLGALAAGGTGMATGTAPIMAGAAGIASLPYLPVGSQLANLLMSKRPELLRQAGGRLSDLAPYAGLAAIGASQ